MKSQKNLEKQQWSSQVVMIFFLDIKRPQIDVNSSNNDADLRFYMLEKVQMTFT